MDKKKTLKYALDLCKEAKFKEATNVLNSVDGEVNNKWLISFIIGCCNVCVANISTLENISEENLHQFLNCIVFYIRDIKEIEVLSYVQSLFHILKYFVKKKCFSIIAKMDGILVPVFLTASLPKKHIGTYLNSATLLYNFIVKIEQVEIEFLIDICKIISKMYVKVSNVSGLLSTSFNCSILLSRLSCSTKALEEYFFNVLSSAKLDNMDVNMEGDFKNFLSYFTLVYHSILKKFDFKEAEKFYEKTYTSAIGLFNADDCINSLIVLKFPLLLSPLNLHDKLENVLKCKRSLFNIENTTQRQQVGSKLHTLIHTIVFSYYKSVNGKKWCTHSEELRLEIIQFIWEVSRLELLPKFSCPCKCLIGKNVYQAFSYFQYACTLVEICVRQKIVSPDFNKNAANLLEQFYEDIKMLKEYNCEKWKTAWNAVGNAFYNIGVYLYQNSDQGCLHYFYSLVKYFIKFEFRDASKILKFSVIGSAFTVICNYNMKDYKKCLAFSALGMKLCPNERNTLFTSWIKCKVRQRDAKTVEGSEVQKLTLVSVFKHFKQEIEFLTGGVNLLTAADKMDLLILELEQYKMKWKSKVPMMSALKELHSRADLDKFVEIIVVIFGDCELMLHDDVPDILQKTLKQFEQKINSEENTEPQRTAFLAVLHYMHYKYCVKDTIAKNCSDMERTMALAQKTDEPPDAIPKDPNDECDIVSSYDCLKLSRYFSVMKYLDKSLQLFASIVKENFDPSSFTKVKTTLIYDLLVKISMEYRLHRYKIKSLQALQLALKVAEFEKDPCKIVWVISFIIENADVNKSYVKYLKLIADKQIINIECDSIPNLNVILTYYIFKAKSLLYEDYKESFRFYEMANKLYEVQEDKSQLKLIQSQLHILHFKYVTLPCNFGVVDHSKSTLFTIHLANSTVYEEYNSSSLDGAYEMSILLDTNEELAKLNHLLKCPREVRSFCKETIILSQQLVLPLRCAYYLTYLAYADLRSSRLDDSQVKIEGLGDILCLTKHYTQLDQENKPPPCTDIEKTVSEITSGIQEMVLDLPVSERYKKQFAPSSPTLVIQPFRLPAFLNHEEDCVCFYCTSIEYQMLVLEKFRLDALLNVKLNNFTISIDFFHGAINFYELCLKKYQASTDTMAKFISYDLIPEFVPEMLEIYGFTLVDYSFQLLRSKNKEEALKVTNKIIDLVYPMKIRHIYLYNDALIQKLGYITEVPEVVPVIDRDFEMDNLYPETNIVSTTPESKHSKVTVQCSFNYSPPKRKVKKCLPFNLSPNEDSSNSNKPQEKTSAVLKQLKSPIPKIKIYSSQTTVPKSKILPTNKLNGNIATVATPMHSVDLFESEDDYNVNGLEEKTSPISKASKTPSARKKINSFDDVVQKHKNPPSTIHIFNDYSKKNKKKVLVDDVNINSNAVMNTPVVHRLDTDRGLRTRTKLLTDKLRKSSKKPEVPVSCETDDNISQADVPNGRKKMSSRRNLFENVNEGKETNVPHGGAIRKSARTRKL